MNKILTYFALSALLIFGCNEAEKEIPGCTDSEATNYNAEANFEDGTCRYIADEYVGTYLKTDSLQYYHPSDNSLVKWTETGGFVVEKTGKTTIRINNFSNDNILCSVTPNNIVYLSQASGIIRLYNFFCLKTPTGLEYNYQVSGSYTTYVRGTATKY